MAGMRALGLALALTLFGCGGESSRLVTVRSGSGSGPIDFAVKNATDVAINSLFMAKSELIEAHDPDRLDPSSPEGLQVWGGDLLHAAIPVGERVPIEVKEPGRWDVRATDRDDREQHVAGLKLQAGGRYILELHDGGWRVR
ncbi:MAG TPA: hypothetical protein VGP93_02750 [Polyangiaceae bacterium]|jgi:hypothetical protein|nr:hypothetical protein [Polyangiaceae bacterium]